jgi:hypothetical protein
MPCHRCGARQDDPVRGPSLWKRGVVAGEQVLVCPSCQRNDDWRDELVRCPSCAGVRLSKTLGTLRCGDCGWAAESSGAAPASGGSVDAGLAEDVQAALERLFSQGPREAR